MRSREQIAIAALQAQEADLVAQLARIRASLRALRHPGSQEPPHPKTRAGYLLEYLLKHDGSVRVKDVPQALEVQGFISRAAHETTNWLYQLPQEKRYFDIREGLVTLRRDLIQLDQDGLTVWAVPSQVATPERPSPAERSTPECSTAGAPSQQ